MPASLRFLSAPLVAHQALQAFTAFNRTSFSPIQACGQPSDAWEMLRHLSRALEQGWCLQDVLQHLQQHQQLLPKLVRHISSASIAEMLVRLVGADDNLAMYMNPLHLSWLTETPLMSSLLEQLSPAKPSPGKHAYPHSCWVIFLHSELFVDGILC